MNRCYQCNGNGWVSRPEHDSKESHDPRDGSCRSCPIEVQEMCDVCNGSGSIPGPDET